MDWFVYMARCSDGTFYTGITTDVRRRFAEHNEDDRLAARYTRGRRPVILIYVEEAASRAAAARRELEIRKLTRTGKKNLASGWLPAGTSISNKKNPKTAPAGKHD